MSTWQLGCRPLWRGAQRILESDGRPNWLLPRVSFCRLFPNFWMFSACLFFSILGGGGVMPYVRKVYVDVDAFQAILSQQVAGELGGVGLSRCLPFWILDGLMLDKLFARDAVAGRSIDLHC